MEIKEDYFRIHKKGNIFILCDRIPFIWKEMLIWNLPTFLGLLYAFGPVVGVYIFILTLFFISYFVLLLGYFILKFRLI
jgi:hypothetical protein